MGNAHDTASGLYLLAMDIFRETNQSSVNDLQALQEGQTAFIEHDGTAREVTIMSEAETSELTAHEDGTIRESFSGDDNRLLDEYRIEKFIEHRDFCSNETEADYRAKTDMSFHRHASLEHLAEGREMIFVSGTQQITVRMEGEAPEGAFLLQSHTKEK